MEDTMLSGVYGRQRRNRRLLKWSFIANVKRSLKRYTSELGPAKFLVLLLVKYYLGGSFGHSMFRWTNLDVKWSVDSLPCKADGRPSLGQVTFHLDVLETLYQFLNHSGHKFHFNDSCTPQNVSTRAAAILHSLLASKESVILSAKFLGAVTALRWACSHLTSSDQPALSVTGPDSAQATAPLDATFDPSPMLKKQCHSLPSSVIDLIRNFPVSLTLKKEPTEPKQQSSMELSKDCTHITLPVEEWDWGPLISHCTSAYWECLLACLKWTTFPDVLTPDPTCSGGSDGKRSTMGCKDTINLMECCVSSLDMAASSVGVVIEAVATLVPKLLLVSGGCEVLVSATPPMWSHVMELKSYQVPFWRALQSYVGVVFHPSLLLQHSSNPNIMQMQESCIRDFVELGEAKLGTFNILMDHVLNIWEESLSSLKAGSGGSATTVSLESLFQSLRAHCGLLLHMATFGPIHKKNLRNVEEVELFLDKLDRDIYSSLNITRYTELNANVRVKMILFVVWLAKSCSGEVTLASQFNEFMSTFTQQLLKQLDEVTESRKHYYLNSSTHRVKLRLSQTLLVIVNCLTEDVGRVVADRLLRSLQSDNQLSVRYFLEWAVVMVMVKYPASLEMLYQLLEEESDLRLSRMCSVFTITRHVGSSLPEEAKASHYLRVLPTLLHWSFSFHFVARLYGQTSLVDMWEDCLQLPCLSPVLQSLDYLQSNVQFLKQNGDCHKFSSKIKSNVFYSLVKTDRDKDFETIFHILPLLCNVFLEEVTAPGCFEAVMVTTYPVWGSGFPGMALRCSNSELCEALTRYLSISSTKDGSHTRSIAYRLKTETPPNGTVSATVTSDLDVQKKISLLSNPSAILQELFPHSDCLAAIVASLSEEGGGQARGVHHQGTKSGLVVVASLLSKIPNLGGICRTGEIYGIESLVLSDKKILEEKEFQSLSVTAEKWMNIQEVKLNELQEYLVAMREAGYSIVGLEQTMKSKSLSAYKFKHKTVVVLGNEREGIPPSIIYMLDHCIEIPQHGTIRSLNVHVSAALVIWEYSKQFLHEPTA